MGVLYNIWKHIRKYKWLYTIILFIIILANVSAGIALFFLAFISTVITIYREKDFLKSGELKEDGPNIIKWFDNICFINTINYLFSTIDTFPDDIRESIEAKGIKDNNYINMVDELFKVIDHVNRVKFDENYNHSFIEEFKKVCNNRKSVFWKGSLWPKKLLGDCADGLGGSSVLYLTRMLKSSGLINKYGLINVKSLGKKTLSRFIKGTKKKTYIFVYIHRVLGRKITGLRRKGDVKDFNSFDDFYVLLNDIEYDIISYSHIWANPAHSQSNIRVGDKGEYKWFKMVAEEDYDRRPREIDINELKETILWSNTTFLLKRRNN